MVYILRFPQIGAILIVQVIIQVINDHVNYPLVI